MATDFDLRLGELESKIDSVDGRIDKLTQTLEDAMILFSHSDSSKNIEVTERRFQSSLTDTTGIQSRYKPTQYGIIRSQV